MRRLLAVLVAVVCCIGMVGATELSEYGNYTTFYHNITAAMGAQTDYQVKFILSNSSGISGYYAPDNIIYTNGTTRADWFDVNATDGAGAPLPFWIENNTYTAKNATAWVKVPTIATDNSSTGRWYYGNSSQAASTRDGLNTFPLWDDFDEATINTTKWTASGSGTRTVGSSYFHLVSSDGKWTHLITNTYKPPVNSIIESRLQYTSKTGSDFAQGVGLQSTNNSVIPDEKNLQFMFFDGGSNTVDHQNENSGSWGIEDLIYNGMPNSTWVIFHQRVETGSTSYYVFSDARASTLGSLLSNADAPTGIGGNYYAFIGGRQGTMDFDWVIVRKYLSAVPTTSLYTTTPQVVGGTPISASFTSSSNPSTVNSVVAFTDTSTGTPTTWNWTLYGTSPTNTTQHSAYTYSATGTYTIFLNVTNSTGYWSNTSQTHTVTNTTAFTEQDVWLSGQYLQTFAITDSGTLAAITNVSIVSSSGKSYQTTNGTGYLTEPFGLYTITFSSDGYYPRTISYVFDADGTHAVALTETGAGATDINLQGTPKDVKFHIQSFWGAPLTDATIAVQGVTTTTGSWDWVSTLLSIDLEETPIQNTSMSGLTDSNGDAVFLMLDSIKYNISVSKSGYTFPATFISPQASQYTISANMNESWFASGNDTLKEVNVSVSWVTKDATHAFINITYQDDTGTTTGGDIKVYRDQTNKVANLTPVVVMNITASVCSNSTEVPVPAGGASYTTVVNATTTGDPITRTFTHYFKGAPVTLPGWTSETLLWLSLFIIIFTAAFAGAIHSPQMSVVLCVESWVFWAIGWLDYLVTDYFYSEVHVIGILTLATFLTVLWNITEGKAKGKRSS